MTHQERIQTPNGDTLRPGDDYWARLREGLTEPSRTEAEASIRRLSTLGRLSRTEAQGAQIPLRRPGETQEPQKEQ